MLRPRVIPCLLLEGERLVKSIKFKDRRYIGDLVNTVRIFSQLEVDEIIILDITATAEGRRPNFDLLAQVASECFMPLAYGGGVRTVEDVLELIRCGAEKVAINTALLEAPETLRAASDKVGAQAMIASIDARKSLWGGYKTFVRSGTTKTELSPVSAARRAVELGAGEILLSSIDRDGTWSGFDIDLVSQVTQAVSVPVVASGGAGKLEDIGEVISKSGASAAAVGSMVVYQGKDRGVLVNFPAIKELESAWY